jgi:AraC-like DNA-binding protein
MTFKNEMRPVHPGEVLREEYLKPRKRIFTMILQIRRKLLLYNVKARRVADLSTLAADLGFFSHSHFAAAFPQACGRSPTAFKQSAQRS